MQLRIQGTSAGLGGLSAPLLEKELDALGSTLVTYVASPVDGHGACARAALATEDHPINSGQVDRPERPEKRLDGEKSDGGVCTLKVLNSVRPRPVFDRDTKPDMPWGGVMRITSIDVTREPGATLREHLVDMVAGSLHRIKNLVDEQIRDLLVEEITHGVHENHARATPTRRLGQALGTQGEVETALVGVPANAAEALCKTLCVAVVTTRADFGAASDGIPSGVSPFDRAVVRHYRPRKHSSYDG